MITDWKNKQTVLDSKARAAAAAMGEDRVWEVLIRYLEPCFDDVIRDLDGLTRDD